MNKIVAICLLALPLGSASADDAFQEASGLAFEIIGSAASSPLCQPPDIDQSQRKRLSDALTRVTATGLSGPAGLTPLDLAVIADDVPSIERFSSIGYSLSTRDAHGGTLLHGAALSGSKQAMLYLLAHGADPNAANRGGATPLMVAAAENRADIALTLMAAGASAVARDSDGSTALHYAMVCRSQSLIAALLAAGAPVDARAQEISLKYGLSLPSDER